MATTSVPVDLASAYNLLGLALRNSGSDLIATKKAFLAGLSVAPDNLALLVNGAKAHEVRQANPTFRSRLSNVCHRICHVYVV